MTTNRVYAYNELTQVVALVPAHYLTHPILGANLREVRNGKTRGRLSEVVKDEINTEEPAGHPTGDAAPTPGDVAKIKKED